MPPLLPLLLLLLVAGGAAATLDVKWIDPSLSAGLTAREQRFLLDVHNLYRRAVATKTGGFEKTDKPRAADMRLLEWDTETAARAQAWADQCGGPMHSESDASEGQNYAGQSSTEGTFRAAFEGWVEHEAGLWAWGARQDEDSFSYLRDGAGHFTQVVWSKTIAVGCGFNSCPGQLSRFVCNYRYSGNYGPRLPYAPGPPCSRCDPGFGLCVDGALCARRCPPGARCECSVDAGRCRGRFEAATCSCHCPPGRAGLHCDEPCRNPDGDEWCYDPSHCRPGSAFFVQYQLRCPRTCGVCQAASGGGDTSAAQTTTTALPTTTTTTIPSVLRRRVTEASRGFRRKTGRCRDRYSCEYYVRAGSCAFTEWARRHCPFSCGFCSAGARPTFPDIGCADFYSRSDCEWYSHSTGGYDLCQNREWARGICRRTCGVC